jgi:transcriptional regulator with XRE-family HTH domain
MVNSPLAQRPLGPMLRRWRTLHRIKQLHAAELFGVTQSTISRWEAGVQDMAPDERLRAESLLRARLSSSADHALARLIDTHPGAMHLVCDLTHRLLASSPARAAEFGRPIAQLIGHSLWRYATEAIAQREASLDALGWHDDLAPPGVEFSTGANDSVVVPIRPSVCRWTRMTLSDGTAVRLVETLRSD